MPELRHRQGWHHQKARLAAVPRAVGGVRQHGQSAPLGRAPARPLHLLRALLWLPRAARHFQGRPRPLGSQPRPLVLKRASSKVAHSAAFDCQGTTQPTTRGRTRPTSSTRSSCGGSRQRTTRPSSRRSAMRRPSSRPCRDGLAKGPAVLECAMPAVHCTVTARMCRARCVAWRAAL